jgi:hypothetical protein
MDLVTSKFGHVKWPTETGGDRPGASGLNSDELPRFEGEGGWEAPEPQETKDAAQDTAAKKTETVNERK